MMLRVSETAHENDGVVPDIGRGIVQSSTTRKCRRNSSQWVRNTNSFKRASSEKYVNKHQEIVSAKKVGHPCKCKRKGFEKIEDKIKATLERFLQLCDKDKQDAYLFSLTSCNAIKRRRPRIEDRSMQWSSSYYYRVKTQGGDVCKQASGVDPVCYDDRSLSIKYTAHAHYIAPCMPSAHQSSLLQQLV